jgi:hypothetical protein
MRLTSRASCDVEETNVLNPAEPPITLFDVGTDRIRAAYLLKDEPVAQRIRLKYLHVFHNQVEQLPRFSVAAECVKSALTHPSLVTRPSPLDAAFSLDTLPSPLFARAYRLWEITCVKPATETVGCANLPPERLGNGELGVNLKGSDPPGAISPATV